MEVFDVPAPYYPSDALSLDELAHWIAFNRVQGIGPVNFKRLLDFFAGDMAAAWRADGKELARAGLHQKTIDALLRQRAAIEPARELERLEQLRVSVVTWKDKSYPALLREIELAPPLLYMYGTFRESDQFALAVVGTRNASSYGKQTTEYLVTELAKGQVTIVSGLALGIDTVAHNAALNMDGGRTIAVLACGLDTIYPAENRGLARRIVESGQGVLVSEYPLGVQPESGNFPARNRIIAGLSLGVLVTEAPGRSGALITAEFALKQGREVFAVPGNIFASRSGGVHQLIQDGARLTTKVQDILEAIAHHSHSYPR